jgi:hypothetical protein
MGLGGMSASMGQVGGTGGMEASPGGFMASLVDPTASTNVDV